MTTEQIKLKQHLQIRIHNEAATIRGILDNMKRDVEEAGEDGDEAVEQCLALVTEDE